MEWAHSQTGRRQGQPQQVHLNTLVTESIELLENSANKKQITLHAEIPENLCAFADKNMLKTVIRNLVSNAIKYTESGGEINIETKNSGEWIEIAISDTGVGIKEQYLRDLFRINVHRSTEGTAGEKGFGLGLILCKEFVEQHGGTIRAESEVGTGSTFTFTISLKQP